MIGLALCGFIVPLALGLVFTRLIMAVAPRIGLVDLPGARKVHAKVTPLGGGVAIHAAVMATLGLVLATAWVVVNHPTVAGWLPALASVHAPGVLSRAPLLAIMIAAATVQMLLGLADDWRDDGLDYRFRLLVEVLLVAGLAAMGVRVKLPYAPDWIAGAITVLWVVGLTNAINFLDNMDGLAGGVSVLAATFFATVMLLVGSYFVAGCFLIVAGAILGFLRYNWHPAKIFMGDAGSNFLGFWLGMLSVLGTYIVEPFGPVTLFAPLCILAVPIYDSASVIALRLLQGKSPFQPDKQHFSHRLVQLGLSTKHAVLLIYLVTATTAMSGIFLYFLDVRRAESVAPLVVVQVVCVLGIIALLEITAHRRARRADP